MTIEKLNELASELVKRDYSNGHSPTQAGPTKTSRALAIIHLAAYDAYAKVTGLLTPKLGSLPDVPAAIGNDDATGTIALLSAGTHAAKQLYPDEVSSIDSQAKLLTAGADPNVLAYGKQIADAWLDARNDDGSAEPQFDTIYKDEPGHHRPDPLFRPDSRNPIQPTLGRNWGKVTPFVLSNIETEAFLAPPPDLNSARYAAAFDQVIQEGRNDIIVREPVKAAIGIFWGYDGTNQLGTPPRLYNQVVIEVLKLPEFQTLSHADRIKILTAVNVAMADAGIAAWYWKYEYDLWRPVIGIREADKGWGPTGEGDGNTLSAKGDPFWLPLGAPKSNPFPSPVFGAAGANFTPNFPAYPSGHATFGTAAFETVAKLLGKTPEEISVKFVSDELNGQTTDNTGTVRPCWKQEFTLREAIEQNNLSRIYLGVHWIFDATGGESVGKAIANKVFTVFQ
jgi:hypothetical protein